MRHYSEDARPSSVREDLVGWYSLGNARFDLGDLAHCAIQERDDVIEVLLDENVSFRLTEQEVKGQIGGACEWPPARACVICRMFYRGAEI